MNYYYSSDGSTVTGPHSLDELCELHQSGALPPTTQVCREDEVAWQPLSAILTTPPPVPQQRDAWYYSQDGTRLGPINEDQIRKLIAADTIGRDSLVWCEGLADWTPAHQTDIRHLFGSASTPPPLPGESVNNGIVWTVAFVPILAIFLEDILARVMQSPRSNFWWVALALNIGLCLADERNLKNAGHDTKGMTIRAVLLVPVYLFVRASRLKQNNGYAIVSLATFFVSVFIYYSSNAGSGNSSLYRQPNGRLQADQPTSPPSTIPSDLRVPYTELKRTEGWRFNNCRLRG